MTAHFELSRDFVSNIMADKAGDGPSETQIEQGNVQIRLIDN